ncbi:GNAT family N-acetyltransferase [Niabella sp. CJ426]|uniref:GNAT family N-acetyltransferase n=1 Tax=Niabella sp. CJ426 TaxID=3393740 RepID=UPI003CFC028A
MMIKLEDIHIRKNLMPGDVGFIAYLHGDLYAKECGYGFRFEAYVLEGMKDFIMEYDEARDSIWICEHNNRIIGSLIAQHRESKLQLRYFIFQPAYRGIGLGKLLMQEFIGFMRKQGIHEAYLWTTADQQAAITLYQKYGFQLTEETASKGFDKPVMEQRYELKLG